ncbi:hypothetical protein J113_00310 [Mycobacterium tuberculosis CAS/NITR204]|uniref:Transcription regulator PadR N-terminal domain-containing protein n=1 Tax=Mycobacterium tuberculosis CAS/NITR204 TaxID=1310114 RepID=R4MDE5_MYCTX|nr:hypothetical protein J113_00310 [Mycobacterium tuberculosis CAS/NITR204]
MLELAILGLLIESPMHGYELRKRLTGLLGAFRAFSYGSLYPALRRMQADGLIAENAAPAGTPVRRARRVYQLTDKGPVDRRAGGRHRPTQLHRRRFRGAPGVLQPHPGRSADAHPGRPAPPGRGTPGRLARGGGAGQQFLRPLHPPIASTRARVQRARGQVAQRAHRRGTGSTQPRRTDVNPARTNTQDTPEVMRLGERLNE